MTRPAYDFYADMYETHTEIGYLLWIILALATLDVGLGLSLWTWPRPDVYLVPGIDSYGQVSLQWGAHRPTMPASPVVRAKAVAPLTMLAPITMLMPAGELRLDPQIVGGAGPDQLSQPSSSSASAVR